MILSDIRKAGPYAGDGVTKQFPFAFKVFKEADVAPVLTSADGTETTLTSGYTVDLNTNQDTTPGGLVTMAAAPASGQRLTLTSNVLATQPMQLTNNGGFFPRVLNDSADRLTILLQQLYERMGRTLVAPVSSTEPVNALRLPSAAARAGKLLAFAVDGSIVPVSSTSGPGDGGLRTDIAQPTGGGLVGHKATGFGAVTRSVLSKLRDIVSARDFGAAGTGLTSDLVPLKYAVNAARLAMTDGSRAFSGEVTLPPGRYLLDGLLDLAELGAVAGLTIRGAGSGCTEIVFANSAATITCAGGRDIVFRDVTLRSIDPTVDTAAYVPGQPYGVDADQTAFTVNHVLGVGAALRSWRFEDCLFAGFWKCFNVTGDAMCSEFFFVNCGFAQCYHLMDNTNYQAVNWNFVNCNWENEGLDTVKDKALAAAFKVQRGTTVCWTGGSMIFYGRLVYFNFSEQLKFYRNSHGFTFTGCRFELVDHPVTVDQPNPWHPPILDRPDTGYQSPGNAPVVAFDNCLGILRNGINPATFVLARLWDNCTWTFRDCRWAGGKVLGIYGPFTSTSAGRLVVERTVGLIYDHNTANRVTDHVRHDISIDPASAADGVLAMEVRNCDLTLVNSTKAQRHWVQGPTGSLPQAGTEVTLPRFDDGTVIDTLFIKAHGNLGLPLTVDLKDAAGSTSYATLTVPAGASNGEVYVGREVGYPVGAGMPNNLKLVFSSTGGAQVAKGRAGVGTF